MVYSLSSERASSMYFVSQSRSTPENPFCAACYKLLALLSDSSIDLPELDREVQALQQVLKAKLQQRTLRVENARCHVLHDMKNALTGIVSCAYVLNDDELAYEERQEFLQSIGREIKRIAGIAGNLNTSRDDGVNRINIQHTSVDKLFAAFIPIVETQILAGRNITLRIAAGYRGPLCVDVERIRQAFMNIVYNARDAMPEGGRLTIRSRLVDDETVLFEFIDNGCGMSPERLRRIFEPFATEGKSSGTGLGMAIVKEIVDEHRGEIAVESSREEGTIVRIWLPVL